MILVQRYYCFLYDLSWILWCCWFKSLNDKYNPDEIEPIITSKITKEKKRKERANWLLILYKTETSFCSVISISICTWINFGYEQQKYCNILYKKNLTKETSSREQERKTQRKVECKNKQKKNHPKRDISRSFGHSTMSQ